MQKNKFSNENDNPASYRCINPLITLLCHAHRIDLTGESLRRSSRKKLDT
ncbi:MULTISPECIES: hypothetical protein [unclassified Mesorhizobium]|nr:MULTISPECIES: hypothetical protein [unclassified Mesorhizobium]